MIDLAILFYSLIGLGVVSAFLVSKTLMELRDKLDSLATIHASLAGVFLTFWVTVLLILMREMKV